ncbi:MAG: cell division topological specificity factor MinE [Selenomonadaceae bacterium]|nr:cell division topological specificity factor MinE [Selenomonadaceae bacterium]
MLNFFRKNFGVEETKSSQTAKHRLQVILNTDRNNISVDIIEQRKKEIFAVASKFNGVSQT